MDTKPERQTARIVVMLEPSLYKRLKVAAFNDRCSISRITRLALEKYLVKTKSASA
jgi:hypothetical protein